MSYEKFERTTKLEEFNYNPVFNEDNYKIYSDIKTKIIEMLKKQRRASNREIYVEVCGINDKDDLKGLMFLCLNKLLREGVLIRYPNDEVGLP